jgi:hypothetical protein
MFSDRLSNKEEWEWYEKHISNYFRNSVPIKKKSPAVGKKLVQWNCTVQCQLTDDRLTNGQAWLASSRSIMRGRSVGQLCWIFVLSVNWPGRSICIETNKSVKWSSVSWHQLYILDIYAGKQRIITTLYCHRHIWQNMVVIYQSMGFIRVVLCITFFLKK